MGRVTMHDVYLRFSYAELAQHFAPVGVESGDPDRHLAYYRASLLNAAATIPAGSSQQMAKSTRLAHQIEKDERFWIVDTLMTAYHRSPDRVEAFAALLAKAGLPAPGEFDFWHAALGRSDSLRLYFEVNLPAPAGYQVWLRGHLAERALVPLIRKDAITSNKTRLEGATKADAMLIPEDTNVAVLFEAKVLSDVSVQISYDAARNQLARTIDVMLDHNDRLRPPLSHRDPNLTAVVLVTPGLFKKDPTTRLYGWLMEHYRQDLNLLRQHLPHRVDTLPADLPKRLGWISWEECREVMPEACPWLEPS